MVARKTPAVAIGQLETLIYQFTKSATDLIESDHKKVDLMYEFLFVGRPNDNPPLMPFVSIMQRNTDDIRSFKKAMNKAIWISVGLLLTALGGVFVAIYNHLVTIKAVGGL